MFVAHRLRTVWDADLILVLGRGEGGEEEGGRVVESGRHAELVAKGGLYAELWKGKFSLLFFPLRHSRFLLGVYVSLRVGETQDVLTIVCGFYSARDAWRCRRAA